MMRTRWAGAGGALTAIGTSTSKLKDTAGEYNAHTYFLFSGNIFIHSAVGRARSAFIDWPRFNDALLPLSYSNFQFISADEMKCKTNTAPRPECIYCEFKWDSAFQSNSYAAGAQVSPTRRHHRVVKRCWIFSSMRVIFKSNTAII